MVTLVSSLAANAPNPILVTLFGMVTLTRLLLAKDPINPSRSESLFLLKTPSPIMITGIPCICGGITTSHLLPLYPIISTPLPPLIALASKSLSGSGFTFCAYALPLQANTRNTAKMMAVAAKRLCLLDSLIVFI
jgi:hypothetical protein